MFIALILTVTQAGFASKQGDQIGRFFAHRAIAYFGFWARFF
jgi:hypothetical protein